MTALLKLLYLLVAIGPLLAASNELRIYSIDVEGGKSTLFVAPNGETMLIDAGYSGFDGRDTNRIVEAANAAGVVRIDYLVVTHYHADHVGGVPQLAARMPIGTYIDRGDNFAGGDGKAREVFDAYLKVRDAKHHRAVKPGDMLTLGTVEVRFVTVDGAPIAGPLAGAGRANPLCSSFQRMPEDKGENAHSLGAIIAYGRFRAADLGDLFWNHEYDLVCPANKLGTVDLYLTSHHGTKTSGSPQLVHALHPRVAVMNNGAKKGGSVEAWQTVHDSPGLAAFWQLHYSNAGGPDHNVATDFIANPAEDCRGAWIEVTARPDASFTVRNSRNGLTKTYASRR